MIVGSAMLVDPCLGSVRRARRRRHSTRSPHRRSIPQPSARLTAIPTSSPRSARGPTRPLPLERLLPSSVELVNLSLDRLDQPLALVPDYLVPIALDPIQREQDLGQPVVQLENWLVGDVEGEFGLIGGGGGVEVQVVGDGEVAGERVELGGQAGEGRQALLLRSQG